jgi:cytochrome c oxidase subunit 1
VHALDEFFHRKYAENDKHELVKVASGEEILAAEEAQGEAHVELPAPSYWPILLAFGLPVMAYGVIYNHFGIALGAVIVLLSMFGWSLEPSYADRSDYDPPSGDGATKEIATIG